MAVDPIPPVPDPSPDPDPGIVERPIVSPTWIVYSFYNY